ncbi:MAG TPA: hypothetical protein VIP70_09135 [Nitrososphaeraceae archaeon]
MTSNSFLKNNRKTRTAATEEEAIASNAPSQSYEKLSKEFQQLYPIAYRAIQLIRMMYNRLTLVDKLSHKEAKAKIYEDHKHLPGFSSRNIRRSLTSLDNPNISHRIRPHWPKSSSTATNNGSDLSTPKLNPEKDIKPKTINDDDARSKELEQTISQLRKQALSGTMAENQQNQNHQLTQPAATSNVHNFEFYISWEQHRQYVEEMYRSGRPLKIWFNGKIDGDTGKVIAVYTRRISERKEPPVYSSEDG